MPDDNRFAGLSDAVDEPEEPRDDTEPEEESEGADAGGPAFGFDDTTPKSIYVREETLTVLEDTEFEVESLLRREHDVRDLTGREFHDAAVRVMEAHAEEIVEAVLDARENNDD